MKPWTHFKSRRYGLTSCTYDKYVEQICRECLNMLYGLLYKDIATTVKKKCDEEFGGTWHCVVGRNFGCSITHDTKYVMFAQVDQTHVLLFKSID